MWCLSVDVASALCTCVCVVSVWGLCIVCLYMWWCVICGRCGVCQFLCWCVFFCGWCGVFIYLWCCDVFLWLVQRLHVLMVVCVVCLWLGWCLPQLIVVWCLSLWLCGRGVCLWLVRCLSVLVVVWCQSAVGAMSVCILVVCYLSVVGAASVSFCGLLWMVRCLYMWWRGVFLRLVRCLSVFVILCYLSVVGEVSFLWLVWRLLVFVVVWCIVCGWCGVCLYL
jgi:hypothetical protein